MNGVTFIPDFIDHAAELYQFLHDHADWETSMAARKTVSYGKAYNYSQMSYPERQFIPEIARLLESITQALCFTPNNCLINYYLDGKSKMGYHSDQTEILCNDTGIAILSVGETRTLRFRNIQDKTLIVDYDLSAGSLIYMTQQLQQEWQHAIPAMDTLNGRMSLTFRQIR
ncbi:alpha-ketoglutarate-dependent dioxygenase AlkB [Chitinophaga sp.]|uniref:alpha-ketoglutarate-dependent dioxygenase AlkB n=1 Tax=Chitinophaga sp. TaxID=1869181 RepID=UPI0031E37104